MYREIFQCQPGIYIRRRLSSFLFLLRTEWSERIGGALILHVLARDSIISSESTLFFSVFSELVRPWECFQFVRKSITYSGGARQGVS